MEELSHQQKRFRSQEAHGSSRVHLPAGVTVGAQEQFSS
jgi:hypothetical protein